MAPRVLPPGVQEYVSRTIHALVGEYNVAARTGNLDSQSLPLNRPLYLLITDGEDGIVALYTNQNAVRGTTQWYYLDIRWRQIRDSIDALILRAQREIGLDGWRGVFIPRHILSLIDAQVLAHAIRSIAVQLLEHDYEEELKRQRIVQINPLFTGRNFLVEPDLCFVLMPFRDDLRPVYDDHIRPVIEGLSLRCQRADDIFRHTAIIEDIWESINKARFLIADLTGKNPNVFYEVGVAHTVGKDVILITQSIDDVPFDLRHLRHIQYSYTPRGMEGFEQQLQNTVAAITGRTSRDQPIR